MGQKNHEPQGTSRRLGGTGHRRKGKLTPGQRSQQADASAAQRTEKKPQGKIATQTRANVVKGWVGGIVIVIIMIMINQRLIDDLMAMCLRCDCDLMILFELNNLI